MEYKNEEKKVEQPFVNTKEMLVLLKGRSVSHVITVSEVLRFIEAQLKHEPEDMIAILRSKLPARLCTMLASRMGHQGDYCLSESFLEELVLPQRAFDDQIGAELLIEFYKLVFTSGLTKKIKQRHSKHSINRINELFVKEIADQIFDDDLVKCLEISVLKELDRRPKQSSRYP